MVDPIRPPVGELPRGPTFFTRACSPPGVEPVREVGGWVGLGRSGTAWSGNPSSNPSSNPSGNPSGNPCSGSR